MAKWHIRESVARREDPPDQNCEVTFYTRTKDGQYELFNPNKQKLRHWLFPLCVVILVSSFLIASAFGEEREYTTLAPHGLVCDTEEQVREFLTLAGTTEAGGIVPPVEGCGQLAHAINAFWEPIGVYSDDAAEATIVRVESPAIGVQYMFADYVKKPQPVEYLI